LSLARLFVDARDALCCAFTFCARKDRVSSQRKRIMAEAYIVAAARTAGGKRGGRVSGWHPVDLAAQVIDALVERSGADPALVEDVIMGCVLQAGQQSGCIGRMAALASKLPMNVPGVTIDRQCGSSQQALHFAAQAVMSGTMDCVIAAGVESMSRVPMGSNVTLHMKEGAWALHEPG
jgi:acetyl-CoA C-acetyltransferase